MVLISTFSLYLTNHKFISVVLYNLELAVTIRVELNFNILTCLIN